MEKNDTQNFTVKRVTRFSKNTLRDVNHLLSQWYGKSYAMRPAYLKLLVKSSYLLAICDGNRIIGMVTLIGMRKVSGYKGSIEHLIVDEAYRGKGLGKKLMASAMALAKKLHMAGLALTCEPHRVAANVLYKKLGFATQDSKVYYRKL